MGGGERGRGGGAKGWHQVVGDANGSLLQWSSLSGSDCDVSLRVSAEGVEEMEGRGM